MPKCIFPGCMSTGKTFHRIPRRVWTAERWRKNINSTDLNNLAVQELNKFFVCSEHFLDQDYSSGSTRRSLNPGAVPRKTTCLPASELMEVDIADGEQGAMNVEHLHDSCVISGGPVILCAPGDITVDERSVDTVQTVIESTEKGSESQVLIDKLKQRVHNLEKKTNF